MLYPEALEDFEEEDSLSSECIDADGMGTTDKLVLNIMTSKGC